MRDSPLAPHAAPVLRPRAGRIYKRLRAAPASRTDLEGRSVVCFAWWHVVFPAEVALAARLESAQLVKRMHPGALT
jgi:hypothetical protein